MTGFDNARGRGLFVALVLASVLPSLSAKAAGTVRVPEDYATIQSAVNAAAEGSTIIVAPGTYSGGIKITRKSVTIASQFHISRNAADITNTTINVGTTGIEVSGANVTIEGFRFTGGTYPILFRAPGGQALRNRIEYSDHDAISFENVGGTARGNTCIGAGDDCVDADGPTTNLLISGNVIDSPADDGIEIRNYPYTGKMVVTTIRGNSIIGAKEDGIQLIDYPATQNRRFVIERNLIRNSADVGLGLMDNGETNEDYRAASMPERIHVFNNTFDGNRYAITGGDNLVAINNIISRSTTQGLKNIDGNSIVAYTLFWGNAKDQSGSNIDSAKNRYGNPLLTSNFTLGAGSPAIDAGTPSYSFKGRTVLNIGASHFAGTAPDMGRFESGQ